MSTTTNTGRLAAAALTGSQLFVRGERDTAELDLSCARAEGRQPLLLFPRSDAALLTASWLAEHPGPYTLIVPDGTWGQASRMPRREPALLGMPAVTLPFGAPSRYQLRKAPQAHCLSTIEAVAQALGILEGAEVQKALEVLFDKLVERTLWSRGQLTVNRCRYPIPEAAHRGYHRV